MVSVPRADVLRPVGGLDESLLVDARQVNLHRSAAAGLAVHVHAAAALLDDAEDGGQPQPGALARSLGGEERLEQAGLGGLVHAACRYR